MESKKPASKKRRVTAKPPKEGAVPMPSADSLVPVGPECLCIPIPSEIPDGPFTLLLTGKDGKIVKAQAVGVDDNGNGAGLPPT